MQMQQEAQKNAAGQYGLAGQNQLQVAQQQDDGQNVKGEGEKQLDDPNKAQDQQAVGGLSPEILMQKLQKLEQAR